MATPTEATSPANHTATETGSSLQHVKYCNNKYNVPSVTISKIRVS